MTARFRISFAALSLALFLLAPALCGAADEDELLPMGKGGGATLVSRLLTLRTDDQHEWHGELRITTRDRKVTVVPIIGRAVPGEAQWKVIYATDAHDGSGAEKLTVVHSLNGPNEYLYAKAASPDKPPGEPKKLTGAEAEIPLAGSDFWLSDLGFEFFHWPQQDLLRAETRHSRACYVLESTNPNPRPGGYARVLSWIDRQTYAPIQAQAFDADDRKIKDFALGDVMKINGQWELKDMEIRNRQTGSRTKLEFDLNEKRRGGIPTTVAPPQ